MTSLSRAGVTVPEALHALLLQAYGQRGRAYHCWAHIEEVLSRFDEVERDAGGFDDGPAAFLAVLFHDVVYEPGSGDNEERSAELAAEQIREHLPGAVDLGRVQRLIRLTARHGTHAAETLSRDEALFLDCDMAILAAEPEAFARYDAEIRAEYSAVPDDAFHAGRRRFFERVLAAPAIFHSDYFRQRLETPARRNLQQWLKR